MPNDKCALLQATFPNVISFCDFFRTYCAHLAHSHRSSSRAIRMSLKWNFSSIPQWILHICAFRFDPYKIYLYGYGINLSYADCVDDDCMMYAHILLKCVRLCPENNCTNVSVCLLHQKRRFWCGKLSVIDFSKVIKLCTKWLRSRYGEWPATSHRKTFNIIITARIFRLYFFRSSFSSIVFIFPLHTPHSLVKYTRQAYR